jgi:hypothetical protein
MPANWITERPTTQRRIPRPIEAPRLELPVPQPVFERAQPPSPSTEQAEPAKRGAVVVDFYI